MSESVSIKRVKQTNIYDVKMKITKGKILALRNALEKYNSRVGQDLLDMIEGASLEEILAEY